MTKTPRYFKRKFCKKDISDANNPIAWLNIKNCGITIYGLDPKLFVTNIRRKILIKALKTEYDCIMLRRKKYLEDDWSKLM